MKEPLSRLSRVTRACDLIFSIREHKQFSPPDFMPRAMALGESLVTQFSKKVENRAVAVAAKTALLVDEDEGARYLPDPR
jgi:hypothetical protein